MGTQGLLFLNEVEQILFQNKTNRFFRQEAQAHGLCP